MTDKEAQAMAMSGQRLASHAGYGECRGLFTVEVDAAAPRDAEDKVYRCNQCRAVAPRWSFKTDPMTHWRLP